MLGEISKLPYYPIIHWLIGRNHYKISLISSKLVSKKCSSALLSICLILQPKCNLILVQKKTTKTHF